MELLLSLLTHPLAILVIGLGTIVGMLLVLRVNAFVALIAAAMVVSLLAPGDPARKIDRVAVAFGTMAGKIGVLIALAAIIGKCLMASGGAERIVRSFLDVFGPKRVPEALAAAAFLLAPLVFFGTAFYLIIPLARCFGRHTGRDYLLYVLAIGSGGAVTHVLVPPGAGPLLIAANLRVELGTLILAGTLIGIPMTLLGLWFSRFVNRRMVLPVRPYPGEGADPVLRSSPGQSALEPGALPPGENGKTGSDPRPEEDLPSLTASLAPVVLPLALISADTLVRTFLQPGSGGSAPGWMATLVSAMAMLGNPNLALLIAAGIALRLVARMRRLSLAQLANVAEEGLTNCGVMILLVCAGGAFGAMLGEAQVGQLVEQVFPGGNSPALATLWIAFAVTMATKIVVGSSTVAIATSSGMLAALDTSAAALGCHPVYLAMAVSVGSLVFCWMNDPGFWLITRMSGMTDTEALKSWTPWSAWLGLSGMMIITLAAWLAPLS